MVALENYARIGNSKYMWSYAERTRRVQYTMWNQRMETGELEQYTETCYYLVTIYRLKNSEKVKPESKRSHISHNELNNVIYRKLVRQLYQIPAPPAITSHIIPVRITSRSKSAYDKMNYDSDKVRGHAPSKCIHINGGSKIMSKLPSFLVTNVVT